MLKHYKHKYKDVDFKALVLPIIDKNIEGDEVDLNRNTKSVIYAGGVQNWQNIDAMIGSIKKNVDKYKFTILTPNIAEFESKLKASGIASNVVLKSVPRPQVSSYYKESDYGYILRDNSIVNKVACPTKLIEYMSYGVVPIVLNEEMGDFKTFGYSFLSLNNFDQTTDVDVNRLVEMRKNNLHVIKRIKALFSSSKEFLINYKPVKIGFKRNNNYLVCFGQIFFEFLIKKIRQYSR
jgi:hypothetical protein